MPARKPPAFIKIAGAALAVALCAFAWHLLVADGGEPSVFFDSWVYDGLIVGAALMLLLRAALVPEERVVWLVLGVGMLSWAGGEIYWALKLTNAEVVPIPSIADGFYLAYYPAVYVSLMLLLRRRVSGTSRAMWLDGAIAAFAVAAMAASVALGPIVNATSGTTQVVATSLAYPLGDLLLLGLVVAVFGVCGWRPGRAWLFLGLGLSVSAVADGLYLLQSAEGTYVEGGLLDLAWPVAALLVATAAWQPATHLAPAGVGGLRVIAIPVACGVGVLALLTRSDFSSDPTVTVLATVTMLLITARMALTFRENQQLLALSRKEAHTDSLTGLNNRRKLMEDLEDQVPGATLGDPRALILFDLDGFKQYNDAYGHPAGDSLLARLGRRLSDVVAPYGTAYRLGGDEFCVLVRPAEDDLPVVSAATAAALVEHGEGFHVGSSHGAVVIPQETADPAEALQLADRRMYAEKGGRRTSAGRQTRDVLLSTLRERQPELHVHLQDVAEYALAVGRLLELSPEELDELRRAAELHDIGKVAIPDAILNKPGPLNEDEWAFMHRHTIIGERILGSAPALRPVARIVRSSHERWDGNGYPDGLAGEEIPMGARIVAVCDSYDAMTSERPYRPPLTALDAMAELRRCVGTQFDPAVVATFAEAVRDVDRAAAEKATPA